jgi:RND family efflux transporter MFP subunit
MLTAAEAQLAMAQASLKEVATAASYASIRAPFAGQITTRYIDEGDVAAPGYPLLVLEEAGPREAKLSVPMEAAARLQVGDSIEVRALDGLRAMARVRAVAPGVDAYSKTADVRAVLPSDWPTGVSVTALVPVGSTMAVTVPVSAVIRRGQLTGVRVVTPQGAVLRWVRLGRSVAAGERVEVLSGLEAGDEIVL